MIRFVFSISLMMFCSLQATEKKEIEAFFKTLKSKQAIKDVLSYESLYSFKEIKDRGVRSTMYRFVIGISTVDYLNFILSIKDADEYQSVLEEKFVEAQLEALDVKLFELPFEFKILEDKRILVSLDKPKQKLKIPVILLVKEEGLLLDVISMRLIDSVMKYSATPNVPEVQANLQVQECDIFIREGLDISYMKDFDIFYDSKDRLVILHTVALSVLYKPIFHESVAKLIVDERERKLRRNHAKYNPKEVLDDNERKIRAIQVIRSGGQYTREEEVLSTAHNIATDIMRELKINSKEERLLMYFED